MISARFFISSKRPLLQCCGIELRIANLATLKCQALLKCDAKVLKYDGLTSPINEKKLVIIYRFFYHSYLPIISIYYATFSNCSSSTFLNVR